MIEILSRCECSRHDETAIQGAVALLIASILCGPMHLIPPGSATAVTCPHCAGIAFWVRDKRSTLTPRGRPSYDSNAYAKKTLRETRSTMRETKKSAARSRLKLVRNRLKIVKGGAR